MWQFKKINEKAIIQNFKKLVNHNAIQPNIPKDVFDTKITLDYHHLPSDSNQTSMLVFWDHLWQTATVTKTLVEATFVLGTALSSTRQHFSLRFSFLQAQSDGSQFSWKWNLHYNQVDRNSLFKPYYLKVTRKAGWKRRKKNFKGRGVKFPSLLIYT